MLKLELDMKRLEKCADCGGCFSICPSCINLPGYDPRDVIGDIIKGEYEKWLNHASIWQCLECHHCLEICYQHYGFENAMTAMRTLAVKKGMFPPQVKRGWDMFVKTSRLGEPNAPARKRFKLPEAAGSGNDEFQKLYGVLKERKRAAEKENHTLVGEE